jgi:hypothetical protein
VPPVARIKVSTLIQPAPVTVGVQVLPVKSSILKLQLTVNVGTAAPLVIDRLGALDESPAVLPKSYVLVIEALVVNPPVPVQVKLVIVAAFSTVVPAVVCANTILPDPNITERAFVLFELNIPVVNVNPFRSNVPDVRVVVAVVAVDSAPANVVVGVALPVTLMVSAAIVLPLGVIVPCLNIVAVKPVYVPPLDNVKPLRLKLVVGSAKAVVPKSSVLNQLPLLNVCTAVPDPVNVKFGSQPPAVLFPN